MPDFSQVEEVTIEHVGSGIQQIISFLEKMPALKKIDISGFYDLVDGPYNFSALNLSRLEFVQLRQVYSPIPLVIKGFLQSVSGLRRLSLDLSDIQAPLDVSDLVFRNLEELDLSFGLRSFKNDELGLFFQSMVNLIKIKIKNSDFSHFSPPISFCGFSHLNELDLGGSYSMHEAWLCFFLQAAPSLQSLNLGGCSNLTGASFSSPSVSLSQLKKIDLNRTRITPSSIYKLLKKAPGLESLILSECRHIKIIDFLEMYQLFLLQSAQVVRSFSRHGFFSPSHINRPLKNLELLNLDFGRFSPRKVTALNSFFYKVRKLTIKSSSRREVCSISLGSLIGDCVRGERQEVVFSDFYVFPSCDVSGFEKNTILRELSLSRVNINQQDLMSMLSLFPGLERLYIKDCPALSKQKDVEDVLEALLLEKKVRLEFGKEIIPEPQALPFVPYYH